MAFHLFIYLNINLPRNQIQYLFRKGNHNPTGDGHDAVGTLRRIMGFQWQAHLHNTDANQDHAEGFHQCEKKILEVVDHSDGIATFRQCSFRHQYEQHRCPCQ